MNRYQNELDFVLANAEDGSNKVLFTEKDKYYIDIHDNVTFLPENNFIWTSEKSGYNHIYLKSLDGIETQITNGDWEVTNFYGIDSENYIFYSLPYCILLLGILLYLASCSSMMSLLRVVA